MFIPLPNYRTPVGVCLSVSPQASALPQIGSDMAPQADVPCSSTGASDSGNLGAGLPAAARCSPGASWVDGHMSY